MRTGRLTRDRAGYEAGVVGLAFRPDGRHIATATPHVGPSVGVWDGRLGLAAEVWQNPTPDTGCEAAGIDAAGHLWSVWVPYGERPAGPTTTCAAGAGAGHRVVELGRSANWGSRAFTAAGRLVAEVATDGLVVAAGRIILTDAATGQVTRRLPDPAGRPPSAPVG